jgi:hypothetical protein
VDALLEAVWREIALARTAVAEAIDDENDEAGADGRPDLLASARARRDT